MIRAVNLYGVKVGGVERAIWAIGSCDAIARAMAQYGQPATSARRLA